VSTNYLIPKAGPVGTWENITKRWTTY